MLSVFCSPSRYTQGKNATASLGSEMLGLGLRGPAVVVAGRSARRLQRVSPRFVGQPGGGVRVALFDGGQDAGDFAHRRHRAGGKLRRNVRAPIPSGGQNRSPPGAPNRVVRRPIYSRGG